MSTANLHTCKKGVHPWLDSGPCAQCTREAEGKRFMEEFLTPSTPPSSQPASEPLTVEHHASQDREKEWYFVVMEPWSKGIYRRGYGCYISKNLDIVDAEFEALRQAKESFAPVPALPDSDTRWYCPDCDEHHATAELTATPESHQPACPDCGHEVEMEWTDKDFVVPDSDTLPPSETPEVTDVAPAVREEAVRTAARVRDRAKAGEYEMGALDAAVLARGVLLLDAALTCATTSPKVSAASELERPKEDSLKCTICGEPKICANGGCIGDD